MAKVEPKTLETRLIHSGEPESRICGSVSMPVFQSSTFTHEESESSYHDIRYIRLNNTPNHDALHTKLAAIENGEAAIVTASGMAAISTTLLTLLKTGDHMMAQDCLYGGTHSLVTGELAGLGIKHSFVDANKPETWEAAITKSTKVFYVESITNPLVQVGDLVAVTKFAKEHGLVSIIDNTFASPVNFNPIDHGFDLVIHSGTKYLNGHSDIVAGAVIGSADTIQQIRQRLNHLGGSLNPHACFLLHRGLKTLALRVRQQNDNALAIARFLEDHDAISRVYYPGLSSYGEHGRARELFRGFGGMLSFEVTGDTDVADRFMAEVTFPIHAPSLGGVESLITRPAGSSHLGMAPEERRAIGIEDQLIRFSVGIENADELIEDMDRALRVVSPAKNNRGAKRASA